MVAENPDRWAVEELAATFDITGRVAECCDTAPEDDDEDDEDEDEDDTVFESLAELMAKPEVAMLGLGLDAFTGRAGEDAWIRLGGAVDELWEDVLGELEDHLDWTGAAPPSCRPTRPPRRPTRRRRRRGPGRRRGRRADEATDDEDDDDEQGAVAQPVVTAPTSAISGGGRFTADPAAVAAAAGFWRAWASCRSRSSSPTARG